MQLFSPCWRSWLLCFQVLSFLCSFLFFYLVCHKRGQLQNIYDERVIKHGSFVRAGLQLRSTSKGQSWRNAFKKEWPLVVRGNHHSRNAVRSNPLFWHWLKVNQRLQFSNEVRGWQRTAWKRLLVNKWRHVEKFWDKLMKFKKIIIHLRQCFFSARPPSGSISIWFFPCGILGDLFLRQVIYASLLRLWAGVQCKVKLGNVSLLWENLIIWVTQTNTWQNII